MHNNLPTLQINETTLHATLLKPICKAEASRVLKTFLAHPKTSLTPESVNMTHVFRAMGHYVQHKAQCHQATMDKLESMFSCVTRTQTKNTHVRGHLNTLNDMMSNGYLFTNMDRGVSASEIGDNIVKTSEALVLEMVERAKALASTAGVVSSLRKPHADIGFLEDVWCCATEGQTPMVEGSFPLCTPKDQRLIVGTVMAMNITIT